MQVLTVVPSPSADAEPRTYSSYQVQRMTGASPRQTDNWSRKGFIPGMPLEVGSGSQRRWTPEMVETVRWLVLASRCKNRKLPRVAEFVKRAAEAGIFP
jgi:hypothetical protein